MPERIKGPQQQKSDVQSTSRARRRACFCLVSIGTLAVAGAVTGCGSTGEAHGQSTVSSQASHSEIVAPPSSGQQATTASAQAGEGSDVPSSWVMPNEVGQVLQTAQDDVQRAAGDPIFFSHSTDATGRGRFQVLDRDWKVCAQNIPAGQRVAWDGHVVFSVVKLDEHCP